MIVMRLFVLAVGIMFSFSAAVSAAETAPASTPAVAMTPAPAAAEVEKGGGSPGPMGEGTATPGLDPAAQAKIEALTKALVGKWKSVDDAEEMEFDADGGLRAINPGATFIGTYTFVAPNRLHMHIPVFGKKSELSCAFEMHDAHIVLTYDGRKPRRYDRVKDAQ